MERYRFEVFDVDGPDPRARWFDPQGAVVERRLDRRVVENLVDQAELDYRTGKLVLAELGGELYRWLDGSTERWLQSARARQLPLVLYIDVKERLRGLPWELLFDDDYLTVHPARPVVPIRSVSVRDQGTGEVANRPLQVLFMASSPLQVEPVLDFEGEEGVILAATAGRVEVVVEESGSLAGLAERLSWVGAGYFDVLHLSGHAEISPDGPRFIMEGEDGRRADASAQDIAKAIGGIWPRLVFLSGCHTGGSGGEGLVASMAEALVDAGAPAVLGWALPVGDVAASSLAAALYQRLGAGADIPTAVTAARQALFETSSPYWHLLRLYTDRSQPSRMVTPPGHRERELLRGRPTESRFLDEEGRVKVVDRSGFVGRRRELQNVLRQLRPADPATGPSLAVIHAMGGLGKSSLAARLLDRMRPTHSHHAVWVGRVDDLSIRDIAEQLSLDSHTDQQVNKLLNDEASSFSARLRFILNEPLRNVPCLFVFDDFEQNLEPDGHGGHQVNSSALEVLTSFCSAVQRTGSTSRILVTSRYDFKLPASVRVFRQSISGLDGVDLDKKLRLTKNLGPTTTADPHIRQRAVTAAAGIPRLLEQMDRLLDEDHDDLDAQLQAIESTEVDYREALLLRQLLDAQPSTVRRTIALAAVYEIAVPLEAILALSTRRSLATDIEAATGAGLIQAGPHPSTGEQRYLVSPVLRPLLAEMPEDLDPEERHAKQELAARCLYDLWVTADGQ